MNVRTETDPTVHRLVAFDDAAHRRVLCGKDGEWLLTEDPVTCEECTSGWLHPGEPDYPYEEMLGGME